MIHCTIYLWLSAWSHLELWRASFTATLHLHPYISMCCMLSPSTQEVIFLITTSYHNDWYSQCYIYQEAAKVSLAIRCHQHSQPIQTFLSTLDYSCIKHIFCPHYLLSSFCTYTVSSVSTDTAKVSGNYGSARKLGNFWSKVGDFSVKLAQL